MTNILITILVPVVLLIAFGILSYRDGAASSVAQDYQGSFFRRHGVLISSYLVVFVGFWAIFIIVMPLVFMFDLSFHPNLPPSQVGGPNDTYSLQHYRQFLFDSPTSTAQWNVIHIKAFFLTIGASIAITFLTFLVSYPLAFFMAQFADRRQLRWLLLLLIIPYWVNDILRAFAFQVLLSARGLINSILIKLGFIDQPYDFLAADVALYMALVYSHLLIMLFPLYNVIESLDKNQVEAARDLGAPWWHIHTHIVLPHSKPGIASGCTLVFMLTAGAVATPMVLGGPRTLWFTPIVYDRFYQLFNWPQGAAYAIVLLLACIIFVLSVLQFTGLKLGEILR